MIFMTAYHPILSLIAGILILIMPRLLNYIVALYLIITGIALMEGEIDGHQKSYWLDP
jgi:uncharacterized membrane protein